jgi:hypothetical protein
MLGHPLLAHDMCVAFCQRNILLQEKSLWLLMLFLALESKALLTATSGWRCDALEMRYSDAFI